MHSKNLGLDPLTTATQLRVTQIQRSRSATLKLLKTTFQLLPKHREVVFHELYD